jgi:hypothetical protein
MADDADLRSRIEALEAQVDALTGTAQGSGDAPAPEPGGRSPRAEMTRRGLLSVAAGAVAGGAAATLATSGQGDAVDAHVDAASGAHDASAISVEPSGELTATDVRAALADLDARLGGLLQYSPDSLQDYAHAYDEFLGGSTATGQVGSLGWSVIAEDGGALRPATTTLANTPGWYELHTGSMPNGRCVLHHEEVSLYGHPLFVWEMRIVTTAVNDADGACTWRIGLHDDLTGNEPTNGYYFEHRAGSTTLRCRTAQDGSRTDDDSEVVLEAGTAYRLRIASDGGGVAYFSIDDDIVATITSVLPTALGDPFGPVSLIVKTAGTAARSIRVDYFYLLWSVTR